MWPTEFRTKEGAMPRVVGPTAVPFLHLWTLKSVRCTPDDDVQEANNGLGSSLTKSCRWDTLACAATPFEITFTCEHLRTVFSCVCPVYKGSGGIVQCVKVRSRTWFPSRPPREMAVYKHTDFNIQRQIPNIPRQFVEILI